MRKTHTNDTPTKTKGGTANDKDTATKNKGNTQQRIKAQQQQRRKNSKY